MEKDAKIYVAGHKGLVGSSIVRLLLAKGYKNITLMDSKELDLRNQFLTEEFFKRERPEYVFLAAAKVGGILSNIKQPGEFIYDNIQIQNNVINFSWMYDVKKLLFLSSNCVYPKDAAQPYKEESIFTGRPEQSNEAYAIAKLAGMRMCHAYNTQYRTNFITAIPASLYGPNDNFDPENSHFVAALIQKIYTSKANNLKEVILWGSGNPRREIMHVDDAAEGCILLMDKYNSSDPVNIGIGKDYTIREIAEIIRQIIGFRGVIKYDTNKPDGVKQKLLDSNKMFIFGWKAKKDLKEGLKETYQWYVKHLTSKV